jgi:ketosteroid isomerase-like protein
VRRAAAAFNAGDRDRLLGLFDPEIEYRSPMEQRTYPGDRGDAAVPE